MIGRPRVPGDPHDSYVDRLLTPALSTCSLLSKLAADLRRLDHLRSRHGKAGSNCEGSSSSKSRCGLS